MAQFQVGCIRPHFKHFGGRRGFRAIKGLSKHASPFTKVCLLTLLVVFQISTEQCNRTFSVLLLISSHNKKTKELVKHKHKHTHTHTHKENYFQTTYLIQDIENVYLS
jgi:hypothetical protein